jgi:malate dehydrogenase (oxaloacetate-decarboxylating)
MDYAAKALEMHRQWKGKLDIRPKMQISGREDLSIAYTPGVAQPCIEIQKAPERSYELTGRGNLVAVITDGSAVLGHGYIGPEAGMPVMEGKCVLFKRSEGWTPYRFASVTRCGRDCEHDRLAPAASAESI